MTKIEIIKYSNKDLEPLKDSMIDRYKSYFITNSDAYILKVLRENLPEDLSIETFIKFFENLYTLSLIPKAEPIIAEIDGIRYLAFLQERIKPITYPFEWSPSMVRDAALFIIKLNRIANKYGFTLKDSHLYNIIFHQNQPMWVDIGSFEKIINPNVQCFGALSEFYSTVYVPLLLSSRGLLKLSQKIYSSIEKISTQELLLLQKPALRMLPKFIFCRLDKAINLFFKYHSVCRKDDSEIKEKLNALSGGYIYVLLYAIIKRLGFPFMVSVKSLERKIQNLKIHYSYSRWSNYYGKDLEYPKRFSTILQLIKKLNIKQITDIGGNIGLLGYYLMDNKALEKYICIENDIEAIDIGYNLSKKRSIKNILFVNANPFVLDIPELFLPLENRCVSECVTALALMHHLILSQNYELDYCLKRISEFTTKYAFIEFMPMGLYDGKTSPPPVPSYYNVNWFKKYFCKYFDLIFCQEIDVNRVLFVGVKKSANSSKI